MLCVFFGFLFFCFISGAGDSVQDSDMLCNHSTSKLHHLPERPLFQEGGSLWNSILSPFKFDREE